MLVNISVCLSPGRVFTTCCFLLHVSVVTLSCVNNAFWVFISTKHQSHIVKSISPDAWCSLIQSDQTSCINNRLNRLGYCIFFTGAQWIAVNDQYYGARITLPGEGYYYFSNPSFSQFSFQAIYYALNFNQQGSVQPNTAFPLGFSNLNFPNRVPKPVICPSCRRGPNCEFRILNRCDECNPCPNFDDKCTPGASENQPRTCMSGQDNTGNPFTLMFMQNRPDNTQKRELVSE